MKTKLVVVCGPDSGGKTWLAEKLRERMTGNVALVREPGGTEVGEQVRAIVKGAMCKEGALPDAAALSLFFAARYALLDRLEQERPDVAVLDRYWPSSWVYNAHGCEALFDAMMYRIPLHLRGDAFLFLIPTWNLYARRMQERAEADRYDSLSRAEFERLCARYRAAAVRVPRYAPAALVRWLVVGCDLEESAVDALADGLHRESR